MKNKITITIKSYISHYDRGVTLNKRNGFSTKNVKQHSPEVVSQSFYEPQRGDSAEQCKCHAVRDSVGVWLQL